MSKGLIEAKAGSMSSTEEMNQILKAMTADDFRLAYLDYTNNFLTYGRFAEYYGLTKRQVSVIIDNGRRIQEVYANAMREI